VLTLVAFGLVSVATRRATLLQVMGIVLVENGLALAALERPRPLSLVIELGVAVDLTVIAFVTAAFHSRIFEEFGTGDSAVLRSLRD
jgi:hydrogenase-4 membrane subunit HyfE